MRSLLHRLAMLLSLLALLAPGPALLAAPFPIALPQGGQAAAPLDVVINEVAWMGTAFNTADEWMELYNNTASAVDLTGWHLRDDDALDIALTGSIPAHGHYLLERTDDNTIPDIPADWYGSFGTGGLSDAGEVLTLTDSLGNVIDTANAENGAGWPAGTTSGRRSMERINPLLADIDSNWGTNTTWIRNGYDGGGAPINGTPRQRNSLSWPDLVVAKQAPPAAPVGAPISYQITVVNQGPLAAPGVLISDTLPAGFLYSAHDGPYPCSLSGGYLFSCQAGTIDPAGQGQVTITGSLALTASGTLLNLVYATAAITEITGTNNLAQAATLVQEAHADLAVAKTGPATVEPGDALTYTLAISNIGQLAAPGLLITDTLPTGLAFVSQDSPYTFTQLAPQTLFWEAGTLDSGASSRITVSAEVLPTATGTLANQVWATTAITEVTSTNNLAWAYTLVEAIEPDLAVAKAGPASAHPGDPLTYTLAISSIGALTAPGVRLTDTLPAGLAFSDSTPYPDLQPAPGVLVWTLGDLPPSTSQTVLVYGTVVPTAGGTLVNTIVATTPLTETDPGNNSATWTTTVLPPGEGLVVINEVAWGGTADSAADEWMELYNAAPGAVDLAGWTLRSSDGTPTIPLTGTIPPGGYFLLERDDDSTVSDIPADLIYQGGLNNGPPGEVLTLTNALSQVVSTANANGGAWPAGSGSPSYLSMERVDPLAPDTDAGWVSNDTVHRNGLAANGAAINGTPKYPNSPLQRPDLAVTKTGPESAAIGLPITYTLLIGNVGLEDAADVRITDTLPIGISFVSQTSSYPFSFEQAGNLLVWTADLLPTATTAAITLHALVASGAPAQVQNCLAATTAGAETVLDNNSACWQTTVAGGTVPVYLPLVFRDYCLQLQIGAVFFKGYLTGQPDEAVQLYNAGTVPIDLSGWSLCKFTTSLRCWALPPLSIAPAQPLWLSHDAAAFALTFGFPPDYEAASWFSGGNLSDDGDEVVLLDPAGRTADALVYGTGVYTAVAGWQGPPVAPYYASGQVLQRVLDEQTGRPLPDSDSAADWQQDSADPWRGRRSVRPGWDLEAFFRPLSTTAAASITVAIAPDNAAAVLLSAIARAQQTIEMELYQLELASVVDALVAAQQRGVSVTVLLEGGPVGGISDQERWACQQIEGHGGQCWFMFQDPGAVTSTVPIHDRYDYLHSKVALFDREWVVVSSQNPTPSGLPDDDKGDGTWGSRGVLVLTDAPAVVQRAAAIFDADLDPLHHLDLIRWAPDNPYGYDEPPAGFQPITATGGTTYTVQFPAPLSIWGTLGFELFSAPEAALRRSDALLGLLGQAGPGDQIDLQQAYEHSVWGSDGPNLRLETAIGAAQRGARVRLLLSARAFGPDASDLDKNRVTLAYLDKVACEQGLDLEARWADPTDAGIHNKMALVRLGGQGYAHIGSINGSESSSKLNRELALQIASNDVYAYLVAMFDSDWATATPDHVVVSEVLYDPADPLDAGTEWVELYNPTAQGMTLAGWRVGDAMAGDEYGSGRYTFPAGTAIPAHGFLVLAAQALDFRAAYGFAPDYEFRVDPARDDPSVPNLTLIPGSGSGLALGNDGDEVALWDASGALVDVLVYCGGSDPCGGSYPGVTPYWPDVAQPDHSLERRPPDMDTENCQVDFVDNSLPTPRQLPAGYYDCR